MNNSKRTLIAWLMPEVGVFVLSEHVEARLCLAGADLNGLFAVGIMTFKARSALRGRLAETADQVCFQLADNGPAGFSI